MEPAMYLFTLAAQKRVARFTASLHPILFPSDHKNPNLDLNKFACDLEKCKLSALCISWQETTDPIATGNKNNFHKTGFVSFQFFVLFHNSLY